MSDRTEGDPATYHYEMEHIAWQSVLPRWRWPYWQNGGYRMMPAEQHEYAAALQAFRSLVGCLDAPLGDDEGAP